ncbi:hypothetical protein NM688_g8861 [Phlebia brevispora]|uniref:Uncharacterized protein n=1 Tax=Phlebia brevispora TaxID=194682 RepID=A0ACC1RP05_9APHY|nr:hypothetical protein NM688_g8861 [Phlebia brevispora]
MFDTGVVHTSSIPGRGRTAEDNYLQITFTTPLPSPPPAVLLGLNSLDIGREVNPRIVSQVHDIRNDGATINLRSWDSTLQYSSGCYWLVPPSTDTDFQYGHFCTQDDHPCDRPQTQTSRNITFARSYSAPPAVIVWLDHLDFDKNVNYRVKTYATDVTEHGFSLHIDTWWDTPLYGAGAFWAAYSADRTDICSGTFHTNPSEQHATYFGSTFFRSAKFQQPPRVFLALNTLDVSACANLRVRLYADSVLSAGMLWLIHSWDDTVLHWAGGSFIAIA